jgi:hypothetical protein
VDVRLWTYVLQYFFAQNIGIAFTGFGERDELRGDRLFKVVAVSRPQSDADHFECNAYDAPSLWLTPFAVKEWGSARREPFGV